MKQNRTAVIEKIIDMVFWFCKFFLEVISPNVPATTKSRELMQPVNALSFGVRIHSPSSSANRFSISSSHNLFVPENAWSSSISAPIFDKSRKYLLGVLSLSKGRAVILQMIHIVPKVIWQRLKHWIILIGLSTKCHWATLVIATNLSKKIFWIILNVDFHAEEFTKNNLYLKYPMFHSQQKRTTQYICLCNETNFPYFKSIDSLQLIC